MDSSNEESSSSESSSSILYDDIYDIRGYGVIPTNSFFEILNSQQQIERTIAANWIEWYRENQLLAFAELLQVFVSTLGYQHLITLPETKEILHIAYVNHVKILQHKYKQGQLNLLCSDQLLYREKYCNVLKKIVILGVDIIFDSFLMKNLLDFLSILNATLVLEHQHLSIVTAISMFTPLTRIEHNLRLNSEYEIEKLESCENIMRNFYDEIIGQYMLSESDDIFRLCSTALIQWIVYDDYGLKYCRRPHLTHLLASTTHSESTVRLAAASTLQKLYKSCHTNLKYIYEDDALLDLEKFTKEKREAFVRLCHKDIPKICSVGFDIVQFIDRLYPDIFEENDMKTITRMVFAKSRTLARAAGSFLWYYASKKYPEIEIQSLIVFYMINKSSAWDMGTLVDSLWPHMTKDLFGGMVGLLDRMLHTEYDARDFMPRDADATEEEATIIPDEAMEVLVELLLEMMLSYVRQSTTGLAKRDRHARKPMTDLQLLEIKERTQHLTGTLLDKIAQFIESMFDYNAHCLAMILEMTRHLDFKLYIGKEEASADLVSGLSRAFDQQSDAGVLRECVHAIYRLRSADHEGDGSLPTIVRLLDDDLIACRDRFVEAWTEASRKSIVDLIGDMLISGSGALELSTRKMACLIRHVPVECDAQCDVIADALVACVGDVETAGLVTAQFGEFFDDCLVILYYHAMRQLEALMALPDVVGEGRDRTAAAAIVIVERRLDGPDKRRLDILIAILFQIMMMNGDGGDSMPWEHRIKAFERLCDLLIISKHVSDSSRAEFQLSKDFGRQLYGLRTFVESTVFAVTRDGEVAAAGDEITLPQKKRLLIFYFELIWKRVVHYEYFRIVTKHIKNHSELKKLSGEMIKSLLSIEKYNPHVKMRRMIFDT